MSELCRLRRSEGCGACANEFGMRGGELHILRLIAVIALFGHGVNAGNQALHSDGAILLGGNGLLHSVPPTVKQITATTPSSEVFFSATEPVGVPAQKMEDTIDKSIFRHEPRGRAADAYRGLVKEVLEIGEKQRGKSAECR